MHDTLMRAVEKLKTTLEAESPEACCQGGPLYKAFKVIADSNKVIETGSQRVATIVNSLRNFARLDEEDMKQVDLHQGIEDSLMLINHEIKGRIEIIKEFGSLPQVECFPGRLNQVFLNILNNAQQSIEGSGKITIATSVDGATVRVRIADTGGGIPPDKLSKVFDPGYTTKGIGAGTGLGLSICYEIMEEHKGRIEVESEEGTGSSFTVVIPIVAPEQA
jgi:signal transduction histidine kinase